MNPQLQIMLQQAIQAFQGGNFDRADSILKKVLQADSKNLPALHVLGLIKASQEKYQEAADLLKRAVRLDPNEPSIRYNLAKALVDSGLSEESIPHHQKAVELMPQNPEAWLNYGKALSHLGRDDEALLAYDKALTINPEYKEAWLNKSKALLVLGQHEDSLSYCEKIIGVEPNNHETWLDKSYSLFGLKMFEEALLSCDRAIEIKPDYSQALLNKGIILFVLSRYEESILYLDLAIEIKPDYAEAWCNKGRAQLALKRFPEAMASQEKAISYKLDYHEAWTSSGITLHEMRLFEEALPHYDQAIKYCPDYAEAWYNKGGSLKELGCLSEAQACFERAVELNPSFFKARWAIPFLSIPGLLSKEEDLNISRKEFIDRLNQLDQFLSEATLDSAHEAIGSNQPFYLAYQELNNKDLLSQYGRVCGRVMGQWQESQNFPINKKSHSEKIKIGIVSDHIRFHSVWNAIIKGWLLKLDPNEFEIHLFHLANTVDTETQFAIENSASYTSNQSSLSNWAKAILDKNVDTLIYPEIGMHPLTAQLANLRLAPIQMVSWGHPETSGVPTMDYYLSAELFESEDSQDAYSEKLVPLPNLGCSYLRLPVEPAEVNLKQLGIDDTKPILICPGMAFKYKPQHDLVFVEIAKRLGKCSFVFFDLQKSWAKIMKGRLTTAFKEAGLNLEDFVTFIPWQTSEDFYGIMKHADVFLDTIGFSGFNTAIQAVDCALPIVTLEGQFMRGRLASGILKRMHIPELIVQTEAQYIDLAVRLVQDRQYREQISQKMIDSRDVLYDDSEPIRALENFLKTICKDT